MLGESPPLPSRTFFGRDELIENVVNLAKFTPIALIGAGGIGKTGSGSGLVMTVDSFAVINSLRRPYISNGSLIPSAQVFGTPRI